VGFLGEGGDKAYRAKKEGDGVKTQEIKCGTNVLRESVAGQPVRVRHKVKKLINVNYHLTS